MKSGLMFHHFADLLRGMIKLQHLYVRIYETTDTSFARFSLVEGLLLNNVVEFHYAVSFSVPLSTNIETELTSSNSTRFKVKRSDSLLLYTVPWSWNALHLWVPPTDYQQIYQRTAKSITIRPLNVTDEAMVSQLQPWLNVTEVIAKTKLPSLAMFRHLKTLKTSDADVVRTSMRLILRSLKITGWKEFFLQISLEKSFTKALFDYCSKTDMSSYQGICLSNYLTSITNVFICSPLLNSFLHLYVRIYETTDTSFARFSLVEGLLLNNVVKFHYAVSFSVPLSTNIETELTSSNSTRFKVKRSDSLLFYTVPWSWNALHLWVPPTGYQQIYQRTVKSITIRPLNATDEAMVTQLQSWLNVTEVIAKTKLPSLAMFRHLKTLKTSDADVVRTSMPLTLRSLKITDKTPLALNAPFSTLVHGQVHKFNLFRPLRDEQELLNVLHQFPNLRFLSIVLPSRNSKECLINIFDVDNVGLSRLVCLQARKEDAHLWKEAPFEWLIIYTRLKYRLNPFHVNFSERKGLVVWL
ncbi:unnamed protein product [Rotaria socialis]